MNLLTSLIIRPQRNVYDKKDLGDNAFSYFNQDFKRLDFNTQIKNKFNQKLSTSLWCPLDMTANEISMSPCILYCHGNAGNKIDIIEIFQFLYWEFNICSFDFSGAGFSEGEFVTLGWNECYDIEAVVSFLRKELNIQKIIVWGRSMGAVSALRYAELDPNLKAIVLDSPFADFPDVVDGIMTDKLYIPRFLSKFVLSSARDTILERVSGFDIFQFKPKENAKNVRVPTFIIHASNDKLIPVEHSRQIIKAIPSTTFKRMIEVDGDHNSSRNQNDINLIREFILQFSYDPIILKEHKRRLLIKSAHKKYLVKNGININHLINKVKENLKANMAERESISPSKSPMRDPQKSKYEEEDRILKNFTIRPKVRSDSASDKHSFTAEKERKHRRNLSKSSSVSSGYNSDNNIGSTAKGKLMINMNDFENSNLSIPSPKINKKNMFHTPIGLKSDSNKDLSEDIEKKDDLEMSSTFSNSVLIGGVEYVPKGYSNSKNILRSERFNVLSSIMDCGGRIMSSQIKFSDIDKSNFK